MVYLNADGTAVEKRTVWRVSIVSDFLWGVRGRAGYASLARVEGVLRGVSSTRVEEELDAG